MLENVEGDFRCKIVQKNKNLRNMYVFQKAGHQYLYIMDLLEYIVFLYCVSFSLSYIEDTIYHILYVFLYHATNNQKSKTVIEMNNIQQKKNKNSLKLSTRQCWSVKHIQTDQAAIPIVADDQLPKRHRQLPRLQIICLQIIESQLSRRVYF